MKELEDKPKDEVKIVAEVKQEKKRELIGSIKPYQGHKCFELNTSTGEVKLAEFKEVNVNFEAAKNGLANARKVIVIKEDHLYTTALNIKNAIKRFKQMIAKP